jgi:hypothetical protein
MGRGQALEGDARERGGAGGKRNKEADVVECEPMAQRVRGDVKS